MNEREILLKKIRKYDFALKELNLYLDTHPYCRRALSLFKNYKKLRSDCINEFTSKYGPLRPEDNDDYQHWNWIDDLWPWERS
jgi:spore coat protein JB